MSDARWADAPWPLPHLTHALTWIEAPAGPGFTPLWAWTVVGEDLAPALLTLRRGDSRGTRVELELGGHRAGQARRRTRLASCRRDTAVASASQVLEVAPLDSRRHHRAAAPLRAWDGGRARRAGTPGRS